MNIDLIKSLLLVAIASSILSTAFVQKIKGLPIFKCSNCFLYISFITSMLIGIIFTLSFTDYDIVEALWIGLFSFLGADTIYKAFEDKVFASFSTINNITEIEREKL